MKSLREILEFRRAVRDFDTSKPIDCNYLAVVTSHYR